MVVLASPRSGVLGWGSFSTAGVSIRQGTAWRLLVGPGVPLTHRSLSPMDKLLNPEIVAVGCTEGAARGG